MPPRAASFVVSTTMLWRCALVWLVAAAVAVRLSGPMLAASPAGFCLLAVATCSLLLSQRYCGSTDRTMTMAVRLLVGISLFAIISIGGALASYAIAAHTHGYADAVFIGIDRDLGFDWPGLYRWWAGRGALIPFARLAYSSISVTPVLIIAMLALSGRGDRLNRFLAIHFVALIVTLGLFACFPLQSPFLTELGPSPAYMPSAGLDHFHVIEALRTRTLASVGIGELVGLIGFPSFHTAAALIFIWAAWPVRSARLPVVAVNLALVVSTPIEGGHYLTDVIGGAFVATFAIALVTGRIGAGVRRVQAAVAATGSPRPAIADA